MSKDTEYVATLIEFTVSEDNERVDLEACLEISDRANATKPECNEAIKSITKALGKSNMKVVLNTIQLLETMCKNCNMRFLYELNNKKLVDALLKVLQRKRDRCKYGDKTAKSSNPQKIEAEDRILYLIQLWADTFMMHQAEFRNIHDAYRNLRKDGVQFPDRDTNEKFMINFQGQQSPIFLAMESNFIVPSNNQGGPVADPRKKTQQSKPKAPEYKHEYEPSSSQVQNTLYDDNDEDYDYSAYDGIQITNEEVKILEESMGILREIERNAVKPTDMKGEIAKEILSDLVHVHKRLKRFIKSEKFASISQRNEAVRLNQMLGSCLSGYKTKYYKLKEDQRRIKTEPDEDPNDRYGEEYRYKHAGRLATEIDDVGAYTDRVRSGPSGVIDKKKAPLKKANIINSRIEPPTGWKSNMESQGLGHNPDLIDLLNTKDAQTKNKGLVQPKFEERKQDPNKNKPPAQTQDLLTDLLDLNFSPTPVQNPPTSAGSNGAVSQFNTAPSQASNPFDFTNFSNAIPDVNTKMSHNQNGQQFVTAPNTNFGSLMPGQQNINHGNGAHTNGNAVQVKNAHNDDDDFFNDIANRKK